MKPESLCFDLDGTLWDAIPSTVIAWNRVGERHRLRDKPILPEDLAGTTGRPITECVRTLFGAELPMPTSELISELEAEEEASIRDNGAQLYPEVVEGVAALGERYRLFIISNCQTWYLDQFFALSGVQSCFESWDCHGSSGVDKPEMLVALKDRHRVDDLIYVGDTLGDQLASEQCGVPFCFAAYGFGQATSFEYSVQSFAELVETFQRRQPGTGVEEGDRE